MESSVYKIRCRICAGPISDGQCLRCGQVASTSSEPVRTSPSKPEPLYAPSTEAGPVSSVGRFQVMAILQAARAEFLGMDTPRALSFGLNRAIFFAAAKRGFAPSHNAGIGAATRKLTESKNFETVRAIGDEQAIRDRRTGWFAIGGEDQTPEAFQRQIASRVNNFNAAWGEAMKLVSRFPDEVLLSREAFFKQVYEPNRDVLAAKWG